jgi:hypothetical protein
MPDTVAAPAAPAAVDASQITTLQTDVASRAIDDLLAGRPDPHEGEIGTFEPEADPVEDAKGRLHDPKDGKFVPKDKLTADEPVEGDDATDSTTETAEAGTEGEATAAVGEKPKEPAKVATEFKLFDAEGKEVEIADVLAKLPKTVFTVGDKTFELPYDRVVRLAKSGVHNEEQDRQAKEAIGNQKAVEAEVGRVTDGLRRQNAWVEGLLRALEDVPLDEDHPVAQIRQRWQAHNSPEARAKRAEDEVAGLRQQIEGRTREEATASFFENDVKSPLQGLLQQFPSLTKAEVEGEFHVRTASLGAVIQPSDYAAVKRIVQNDLPAWAASVHESREAEKAKLTRAREENTILKKRVAHGAKPIGRRAEPGEGVRQKPVPRTEDERIEQSIERVLAG